jgi:L-amino acid N-acyltransferase YncA
MDGALDLRIDCPNGINADATPLCNRGQTQRAGATPTNDPPNDYWPKREARTIDMNLIRCQLSHAVAIRAIFNAAILNSTAVYDYEPRSLETVQSWIATKAASDLPLIGFENDAGELMAFASYGPFRTWPAYQFTIEHSVYVDERFRGQGLGRKLLLELISIATRNRYHMMIGVIDSENRASIAFHRALGFDHCGTIKHAGRKFDRWLDVHLYQRVLESSSDA